VKINLIYLVSFTKQYIKYILFISIGIILFLFLVWNFASYYYGYYGYDKHKVNRYSSSINESKNRGAFIKELTNYYGIPDTFLINNIFVEKSYTVGYFNQTYIIDDKYQVVVSFNEKQFDGTVYFEIINGINSNPFASISTINFNDTIIFNFLYSPDVIVDTVAHWPKGSFSSKLYVLNTPLPPEE